MSCFDGVSQLICNSFLGGKLSVGSFGCGVFRGHRRFQSIIWTELPFKNSFPILVLLVLLISHFFQVFVAASSTFIANFLLNSSLSFLRDFLTSLVAVRLLFSTICVLLILGPCLYCIHVLIFSSPQSNPANFC